MSEVRHTRWAETLTDGVGRETCAEKLSLALRKTLRLWALEFSDRFAVGGVRTQPTGVEGSRRLAVLEKITDEPSIALSFFLSRLPCAALTTLVSTRESILFRVPPFSQCLWGG